MEFVNPGFLYGLLAVSIPVIIHLFNFRRYKKVWFTNVAFIRELKQETQKQSRLKHLLVLLLRMLAIAAVVLAFAQPYIPVSKAIINPGGENAVSIYIDNSFSMQAESEEGTLLDAAKAKALGIASVYRNSDRFQLLTNDFEGRHQRLVNKDEFGQLVNEVQFSPFFRSLDAVTIRQDDGLSRAAATNKTAYVISDFQKNFIPASTEQPDTLVEHYLYRIDAVNANNLYIDSCWFESPVRQSGRQSELKVLIRNSGTSDYEKIPVTLKINGQQRALSSIDIAAGDEQVVTLPFTNSGTGIQYAEVEIPDYPNSFDDNFFLTWNIAEKVRVLVINGGKQSPYLNSLFGNDSAFYFRNEQENMLDYSTLPGYQLIILNEMGKISSGLSQQINGFVEGGGSLIILPSPEMDKASYNDFLAATGAGKYLPLDTTGMKITKINLQHPIFSDVFDEIPENMNLPVVQRHFPIRNQVKQLREPLLTLANGDDFLEVHPFGKGKIYLMAVPLETSFSNFPRHALFVPVFYKIAISSVSGEALYYTVGKNEVVNTGDLNLGGDEVLKIRAREGDFEIIPEVRNVGPGLELYTHNQVRNAGFYTLYKENTPLRGLAFNYDRNESEMTYYSISDLENFISTHQLNNYQLLETGSRPLTQTLSDLSHGKQLWRWFVLAGLLFLLGEGILLRMGR